MQPIDSTLRCLVLKGKPVPDAPGYDVHAQAFTFWRDFWNKVLAGLGLDRTVRADDFFRQDRVVFLASEDTPVGVLCFSLFDLGLTHILEHSYFAQYFGASEIDVLRAKGLRRLMTFEFLGVNQARRTLRAGLPLGKILLSLGQRLLAESELDAGVAAVRADNGAARMVLDLGAVAIGAGRPVNGRPTEFVVFPRDGARLIGEFRADRLVDRLWRERTDLTGEFENADILSAA